MIEEAARLLVEAEYELHEPDKTEAPLALGAVAEYLGVDVRLDADMKYAGLCAGGGEVIYLSTKLDWVYLHELGHAILFRRGVAYGTEKQKRIHETVATLVAIAITTEMELPCDVSYLKIALVQDGVTSIGPTCIIAAGMVCGVIHDVLAIIDSERGQHG